MKRRTFIETSLATAALTALPSRAFASQHQIEKVGVQLYTVRDAIKADFAGTLAKVAAIGYKEVELAGYFDHSAKEIRAMLDKAGLTAPSAHFPLDALQTRLAETIESAHIVGHKFLVCPWLEEKQRNAPDGYKKLAGEFNKVGEATKKAGIQFAYHNHVFEFQPGADGKLPYDVLLESSDPNLVKMEIDLCWFTLGGQDPVAYFNKYPGRFPLVHVKDLKKVPKLAPGQKPDDLMHSAQEESMTEAGSGVIDWKRIFASGEKAGIEHYFAEHDSPKDGFASLTTSYKYLAALRF
jgi:sugar phosphate isomerase/epimerase